MTILCPLSFIRGSVAILVGGGPVPGWVFRLALQQAAPTGPPPLAQWNSWNITRTFWRLWQETRRSKARTSSATTRASQTYISKAVIPRQFTPSAGSAARRRERGCCVWRASSILYRMLQNFGLIGSGATPPRMLCVPGPAIAKGALRPGLHPRQGAQQRPLRRQPVVQEGPGRCP